MIWHTVFGQRAATTLVAVFETETQANSAVNLLKCTVGLQAKQLSLVRPHGTNDEQKIESALHSLAPSMAYTRWVVSVLGLLLALVAWGAFYLDGVAFIRAAPGTSALATLLITVVGGGLLVGIVWPSPDRSWLGQRIHQAARAGRWPLLVHLGSQHQCDVAVSVLNEFGADITRSN